MESALRDSAPADLQVIETLRVDPDAGPVRLPLHLDRLATTCERLGIPFDGDACAAELSRIDADTPQRCRVTVDRASGVRITLAALAPAPGLWRVAIHPARLESGDPWLGVKTTQRRLYDDARASLPDGIDEVLFLNERGEVCEGAITNVFIRRHGRLLTPALGCGLLPGVLRAELLRAGDAEEAVFGPDVLQAREAMFVGNSLRGLIPARLATP